MIPSCTRRAKTNSFSSENQEYNPFIDSNDNEGLT